MRVGPGAELLPQLAAEAPFDFIFIDADKPGYPTYLDWALRLSRVGALIVADNCVRGGKPFRTSEQDEYLRGIAEYDERVARAQPPEAGHAGQ